MTQSSSRAGRVGHAGHAARAVGAALWGPLALVLFTCLAFGHELAGGPLAYGRDTTVFYYPLTEWAVGEVKAGRLPLWLPLIYGGYPLLADGEVGPLYPPNLLLLAPVSMSQAYAAMRALHYAIAALGLYGLARAVGAGSLGATVGGLAFGFGSFMVGHLEHDNILRSAAWLPWLLLTAELALRKRGPARALWTLAGAGVLALQGLGLHIQPLLLSVLALGAYLLAAPLVPAARPPTPAQPTGNALPRSEGHGGGLARGTGGRGYVLPRLRVGAGIVGLGLGLAAMQLVPLYVLGRNSLRPSLVTYDYATSYAVSPPQLLTLLFPYMFHFDAARWWSLWSPHESTLYAGIAPLLLALIGVAFLRTRAALFFAGLGIVSLLLAMGDYLPIKPYAVIWNLPGFAYLRAPARFGLLFELALACLAALSVDWLARRVRAQKVAVDALRQDDGTLVAGAPSGRDRAAAPRGLQGLLAGLSFAAVALALVLQGLRWTLRDDPAPALDAFRIALQTSKENWQLGPWHIYYGFLEFSRPDNVRTALGLLLLAVVPLLLRAWLTRPRWTPLRGAALLGLVAMDMWLFVDGFHPRAHLEQLRPRSPAVAQLAERPGPFRVLVEPELNPTLGANLLVPSGLAVVNGYSSLEPRRLNEYWWSIVEQDNVLLDLFNVGYVLAPRRPSPGQRSFEGTSYHPADRLMSGQAGNRSGTEQFRTPPTRAESVTVVAAIEDLGELPVGTPVAELTLRGADGTSRVLLLRAQQDVGEYRATAPGYPTAEYDGPRVAWAGPSFEPGARGRESSPARLYGATLLVDPPIETATLTVQVLEASGRVHLHGLGLRSAEGAVVSLRSADKTKYRAIYADADVLLLENTAAWPRVFTVGNAISIDAIVPMSDQLLGRSWDPAREILVEGLEASLASSGASRRGELGSVGAGPAPTDAIGRAELLGYEAGRVAVRAELTSAGFLVLVERYDEGWRAWSGGEELAVLRANGVQQAVALPGGSHVVTFVYDPWSVRLGFAVSGIAAAALLACLLGAVWRARRATQVAVSA